MMAKQPTDASEQLMLALEAESEGPPSCQPAPLKVVGFLDAATLAVRREAVLRVRNSGIFVMSTRSDCGKR
jgi:hypothetical protein